MRRAEDLLPPDEQARLAVCAQEPLHAAGSVQPHGVQQARAGLVPDDKAVRALVEAVWADAPGSGVSVFATEALAEDHPHLAALLPDVAGVVVVTMPGPEDHLLWFRGEVAQTVDWLGDQSADNRPDPLSPRNSFDLWRQTVRGRALPWDERALAEAEELGRDLSGVLLGRVEARLAHLGLHDPLTGLPNRRGVLDRLQHALHRHSRGATAAVLFVDLDRFKLVNDSLGHEVADRVLVRAAEVIAAVVRESDTVARLGGDEFVVLCEDLDVDTVRTLAQRLVADLQRPVVVDGHDLHLSASVGVAVAAGHQQAAELLREADTAMYQAKEQGRNQVSPYDAGMRYRALRRLDLDAALRRGLQHDELLVHYQPIVAPRTARCGAWRPCCGGSGRGAASCRRTSSSRSPRTRASSSPWASGCSRGRCASWRSGRRTASSTRS